MTLVIKYGALWPCEGSRAVMEELERARAFRNRLIEIDRGRRDSLREMELKDLVVGAAYREAKEREAATKEAYRLLAADRAKKRSRGAASAFLQRAFEAAQKAERAALDAWWKAQREFWKTDKAKEKRAKIEEVAKEKCKAASASSGVHWGTKQFHTTAMEASKSMKSTIPGKPPPGALWDTLEPHDPKWIHRNPDDQALQVQIIKGMSLGELTTDTSLQIGPAWERASGAKKCCCPVTLNGLRSSRYRTLRMRIGSNPDRSPIWGVWPISMHRDLPPGSRIMRAQVHVRRRGPHMRWTVELTVEPLPIEPSGRETRVVAVDLGWLSGKVDEDLLRRPLRVATWVDDQGERGELVLSAQEVEALRRAEGLEAQRKINLNGMMATLREWIATHESQKWLLEETSHMASWKSPRHIVSLCKLWRSNRLEGDEEFLEEMEAWCRHDRHLWEYESEQRAQGLARRNNTYRTFAAALRGHYTTLCLEDKFVGKLAPRRTPEGTEKENETARSNRHLVGVSYLREYMKQAILAGGPGFEIREVEPAMTTQTDPNTHTPDRFDTEAERIHTYQPSGEVLDQDIAAARNILHECMRERPSDDKNREGARRVKITRYSAEKREGRHQRLKRIRAEKAAAEVTAREVSDKAAE